MGLVWRPRPTPAQRLPASADPSCPGLLDFTSQRWSSVRSLGLPIHKVMSRIVPTGFYWYVKHLDLSHDDANGHAVKAFLIPPNVAIFGVFEGDGDNVPVIISTNIVNAVVAPREGTQVLQGDPDSAVSQGGRRIGQMSVGGHFIVPSRWAIFGIITDGTGFTFNVAALTLSAVFLELPNGAPVPSF